MSNAQRVVYRISLDRPACRSARALLRMRAGALPGVDASAITAEGNLVVVAGEEADLYDDLLVAVVNSGLDPLETRIGLLERLIDPEGLPWDTAVALGLVEPPKEPVRATHLQRVDVRVNGGYDPDTIIVSARVPAEIAFSEGHECLSRVVFDSLGIEADLEHGGALVSLPPLDPGTYPFRCGRDVVRGRLIVE
jgi:hypothetical protein